MKANIHLLIIGLLNLEACTGKVNEEDIGNRVNDSTTSLNSKLNGSFESPYKQYAKGEVFSITSYYQWESVAWQGERLHKQIVLWADANVPNISFHISDLTSQTGTISVQNISLKTLAYAKGDVENYDCGAQPPDRTFLEITDPIINTLPAVISSTDPAKLWLTINVPQNTVPATYRGTIEVKQGEEVLRQFNISVEVTPYELPPASQWQFHLDLWQFPEKIAYFSGVGVWSVEHFQLLRRFYQVLADCGQKVISAHIKGGALGGPSMIQWTKKKNGDWTYTFDIFDTYVDMMMAIGINKQINCFSPIGWNKDHIPYYDEATQSTKNEHAPINSATYKERWHHFLTAFKDHLTKKGWLEKTYLYFDEIGQDAMKTVIDVIKQHPTQWKLGLAYSHGSNILNDIDDASGILEIAVGIEGRAGKTTTFYTSCTQRTPNTFLTSKNTLEESTWMAWHALNRSFDGYLRWAYDYWSKDDPFDLQDGNNSAGDFSLIFRSNNNSTMVPVLSTRLAMLREGIEDYEKVRILQQTTLTDLETKERLHNVIAKFTNESGPHAPALIQEAQALLADISTGKMVSKK